MKCVISYYVYISVHISFTFLSKARFPVYAHPAPALLMQWVSAAVKSETDSNKLDAASNEGPRKAQTHLDQIIVPNIQCKSGKFNGMLWIARARCELILGQDEAKPFKEANSTPPAGTIKI